MDQMTGDRIECLPDVMMGKPVIRGTRVTVEQIIDARAAGEPVEQLLSEYPRLTDADVRAALAGC
jgi:uncharacterized protein (DUF433 family)